MLSFIYPVKRVMGEGVGGGGGGRRICHYNSIQYETKGDILHGMIHNNNVLRTIVGAVYKRSAHMWDYSLQLVSFM